MANETTAPVLMTADSLAVKGLSFTKLDFEGLVESSMEAVKSVRKNGWSVEDSIALNGIFYASMAGLIRAGALLRRETGGDGFPEIHVIAGDKDYRCRENALYGVLEEDASQLIIPYQDTFRSYVTQFGNSVAASNTSGPARNMVELENDGGGRKRKKGAKDEQIIQLQERYKAQQAILEETHKQELIQVRNQLDNANSRIRLLESIAASAAGADGDAKEQLLSAHERIHDLENDINELSSSLSEKEKQIMELKSRTLSDPGPVPEDQTELVAMLRKQLEDKEKAMQALTAGTADAEMQKTVDGLRKRLADAEALIGTDGAEELLKSKETIKALEKEVEELKASQNDSANEPDADMEMQLSVKNSLIATLQQQVKDKDKTIKSLISASNKSDSSKDISEQMASMQKRADEAEQKYSSLKAAADAKETELGEVRNRLKMSETVLQNTRKQNDTLKTQLTALKEEVGRLKAGSGPDGEQSSAPAQTGSVDQNALATALKKRLADTEGKLKIAEEKLQAASEEKKAGSEEQEKTIERLRQQIKSKDVIIRSIAGNKIGEDYVKAQNQIEDMRGQIEDMNGKMDRQKRSYDQRLQETNKKVIDLSAKNADLQQSLDTKSKEASEAPAKLLEASQKLKDLDERLAEADKALKQKDADLEKASDDIRAANEKAASAEQAAEERVRGYEEQAKDMERTMEEISRQIESKDSEISRLKKNSADDAEKYAELQEKYKAIESSGNESKFYNEMLPELIKSIDYTKSDLLIKTLLMAGCLGGIVASLVFII